MHMRGRRLLVRVGVGGAFGLLLVAGIVAAASGVRLAASATVSPSTLAAGEKLFVSNGCSACHTFRAAAAKGTIGPNLDKVVLTATQVATQVSNGGCAIMTKAACAKYKFPMSAFKARLSKAKIAEIAAFVSVDRNKAPAAGVVTTKTSTTSTTGSGGNTTTTATTTTSTTGGGTNTTTTTGGGGGGTDTVDNCPTGKTIPTSGNTDGDDDDLGAPSDGDGCL